MASSTLSNHSSKKWSLKIGVGGLANLESIGQRTGDMELTRITAECADLKHKILLTLYNPLVSFLSNSIQDFGKIYLPTGLSLVGQGDARPGPDLIKLFSIA